MDDFFKTDAFGYGFAAVFIAVFGAIVVFVIYLLLLRSLGAILITRLHIHRRRRNVIVGAINGIWCLLCIGLYLIVILPMVRVQLTKMNASTSVDKTRVRHDRCSSKCHKDRSEKMQLLQNLTSTDRQVRYHALVMICKHSYGMNNELLELDKNIIAVLDQLTKSDDVMERYLAEQAWRCQY